MSNNLFWLRKKTFFLFHPKRGDLFKKKSFSYAGIQSDPWSISPADAPSTAGAAARGLAALSGVFVIKKRR